MRVVAGELPETAERYRAFALEEAHGLSASYEALALGVAGDPQTVELIDQLPPPKRQVNLVFSAAGFLGAPVLGGDYGRFRDWLHAHWSEVGALARERSTQTNEARRLATLLPVLARIPGPLALLEVGASAGLCLYPDRYSFRYDGGARLDPAEGPSSVLLECETRGAVPVPDALPEVAWRAGVDLHPLNAADADDVAWLQALTWPEHVERRERIAKAAAIAAADPPRIVAGDLAEQLAALAAEAPEGATLVVFHSAVIAYLEEAARERFVQQVQELPGHWIANEGLGVLPGITAPPPASGESCFLLSLDGVPQAYTAPHGGWVEWLG